MSDEINTKIEAIIEGRLQDFRVDLAHAASTAWNNAESPIEHLMAVRLLTMSCGYGPYRVLNTFWEWGSPEDGPGGGLHLDVFEIGIVPQWKAGDYRADFLVLLAIPNRRGGLAIRRYVIECDGHEFHEKTKEQAQRDKARDRFFASIGARVFRYTGSEIFRNAGDLLRDLETAMANDIQAAFREE